MSFLNLFSGPSAQKLERKGDAAFESGRWGEAKQAYDRAIHALDKRPEQEPSARARIDEQIRLARNALARQHRKGARDFEDGGYLDDARSMLLLAIEVSADAGFIQETEQVLQDIETRQTKLTDSTLSELPNGLDWDSKPDEALGKSSEEEEFLALCGTLPDPVGTAYRSYGEDFKTGYVALNHGDFQRAAECLSIAMEAHPQPESYIPLELATVFLNLNRTEEARTLLETFLAHHPEALPAYQLLCAIYWEQNDFSGAGSLLASIPEEFDESIAVWLLKGETMVQAGHPDKARDFYREKTAAHGWNEAVAIELAKVSEALDAPEDARRIYRQIMDRCTGCGARIDPGIRHRYAELCFSSGLRDTELLEIYVTLAREIPDKAAVCFDRISRIYATLGDAAEAERFRSFSRRAEEERGSLE